MLRHVCVVTLVLLVTMGLGGVTVQEAEADPEEHGWHHRQVLNTWDYTAPYAQHTSFRLQAEPEFDRYFFQTEMKGMSDSKGVAVAIVTIERQSTSELICRGTVFETDVMTKYQYCPGLRPDHWYIIDYNILIPGTDISLVGVDPIKPGQSPPLLP